MIKKMLLGLLVLCLSMNGIALADSGSSGPGYFLNETALIISNIVLFPFRLLRDIFDPQPLPPRPVMVAYPYPGPGAVMAIPSTVPATAPQAVPNPLPQSNSTEINFPNGDGSYTSITLTKTDKGFLGPQGEFYTDHPTEEQLRTRYCKK